MRVIPDSTHRIVLTREIRTALNLKPGQPLQVSITPGAVLLTPEAAATGKIVRKRKLKVYTGKIPDIDVEEAVSRVRRNMRLKVEKIISYNISNFRHVAPDLRVELP
jgi:bifunctional DNA-binding transcriptional regulator/antitoxin component of YhaV-PrlF toxin-antitoxin module